MSSTPVLAPAEIAYSAADILSRHGHCKRVFQDDEGHYCINGAIMASILGEEIDLTRQGIEDRTLVDPIFEMPNVRKVTNTVKMLLHQDGIGVIDIAQYNNEYITTTEDLILVLKKAAAELELEPSESERQ